LSLKKEHKILEGGGEKGEGKRWVSGETYFSIQKRLSLRNSEVRIIEPVRIIAVAVMAENHPMDEFFFLAT